MNKMELKGLDQEIYFEELDNGLKVYLLPFKNKKNYYASYLTKFGSSNLEFKQDNKFVKVPAGIAHFLEHKLFESENGEDPSDFFARSGTECNASTTYNLTGYIITGTNKLEENLDYLITYVNKPYFTEENVEKEKGIIIEEINMYKNDPNWELITNLYTATFKKHPIRIDIGGTKESVNSINKEDLYNCYDLFYRPSNMQLIIGGNFEPKELLKIIKNNKELSSKKKTPKVELKKISEPIEVNKPLVELEMPNVMIPKLALAVKFSIKDIKKEERYEHLLYVSMILTILFGSASTFREKMLKARKFITLTFDKIVLDDIVTIEFLAESNNSKELVEEILKHFENSKITEEEVERCKKVWIASEVLLSDDVVSTISNLISDIDEVGNIIENKVEIIRKLNYTTLLKVREKINLKNTSLVLMNKSKLR